MSSERRCPACGAAIPAGQIEGLCPRCLLRGALQGGDPPAMHPTTPAGSPGGSFVPPTPAQLAPAFPQLEVLELIGHGGMGAVYKARQPKLDRIVALKILRPEAASDPAFAERFSREARTLARLSHPHIVGVYDFGEAVVEDEPDAAGAAQDASATENASQRHYYFVMEYVDGANLRDVLRSEGLSPAEALAIVPQICDALQYAHEEGVVHRDIKPENILLDRKGRVRIADFGLARLVSKTATDFTLTDTHQVMGTPRYMAPEQMEGAHAVDHRADIYSLGVVFYEMLTGEVPAGHFDPPSRKVAIDVRLDEVVLRSLAREPERRYQHASDVRSDVESISSEQRTGTRRSSVGGRDWVTLSREQIDRDEIPNVCIVCGVPTEERLNKNFEYTPDWAGLLSILGLLAGFFPGLIILALTSRTMRVSCPVCPQHRSHWSRLVWVASLGWLLPVVLAFSGFFVATAISTRPGASVPGVVAGFALGLLLYLIPVVYLASTRISAESMTKNEIRLRRVSAAFARGVRDPSSVAAGSPECPPRGAAPVDAAMQKRSSRRYPAWARWLSKRDGWMKNILQVVLISVFFACLICYFSFTATTAAGERVEGKLLRSTTVTFGYPDPWFEFVSNPNAHVYHHWRIDWFSSSVGLMLVGFVAWCMLWRITRSGSQQHTHWIGSPASIAVGLIVLSALAVVWGFHPLYIDRLSGWV